MPELQWHEQIIIAMNEISLTRNGRVETTEVNAGTWEFAADEQKVTALFEQLQAVDCTSIKRIEPDDPPDGGHTESYTIHYTNGEKCSLVYDPGTTYTNGRLIVDPSKAFVQSLAPPADAASRYRFSP